MPLGRTRRNHRRPCAARSAQGACVPTNVDWRDNFCAPLAGSVQYAAATRLCRPLQGRLPAAHRPLQGRQCGAVRPERGRKIRSRAPPCSTRRALPCHALTRAQKQRDCGAGARQLRGRPGDIGRRAALPSGNSRFYGGKIPAPTPIPRTPTPSTPTAFPLRRSGRWLSRAVEFLTAPSSGAGKSGQLPTSPAACCACPDVPA